MQATAKDLRTHSSELLNTVKRGEEVIISYRGVNCAKLVPYTDNNNSYEEELFGIWKNDEETNNVENYMHQLRQGRHFDY